MRIEAIKYSDYINGKRFNELSQSDERAYEAVKIISKAIIFTVLISQVPLLVAPGIAVLKSI